MAATRHNLSRRAVLGAGVVAPAFLAAPSAPFPERSRGACPEPVPSEVEGPGRRARWDRALAAFGRAEAKLAAFRAAIEALPAERRAFPACEPLDDRFDDLECARLARLRRLLRAPAPDLPALALKIDLVVADQAWELTGAEDSFAALKADARRLCFPA